MGLFLLIIYWSHQKQHKVVLGKDEHYETDSEEEKRLEAAENQRKFELEKSNLYSKYKTDSNNQPKDYSYMNDDSIASFNEDQSQNRFIR